MTLTRLDWESWLRLERKFFLQQRLALYDLAIATEQFPLDGLAAIRVAIEYQHHCGKKGSGTLFPAPGSSARPNLQSSLCERFDLQSEPLAAPCLLLPGGESQRVPIAV